MTTPPLLYLLILLVVFAIAHALTMGACCEKQEQEPTKIEYIDTTIQVYEPKELHTETPTPSDVEYITELVEKSDDDSVFSWVVVHKSRD
jgi:hypothetical protein